MRRFVLVLMVPFVLFPALSALAQTTQAEPATAESSLETEVAELKRLVAEHERRIAALEALLAKAAPMPAMAEPAEGAAAMAPAEPAMAMKQAAPAAADLPPWARQESWRKIQIGMTEDEVVALLGPPDSTRELGFSRTLIYKGTVPGRGYLKGAVKLKDGQVSDLDLPDF